MPFDVCGGLQDNGDWCVPSAVRNRNGIANRDAWNIGGGDGFYATIDPQRPATTRLIESQDGNVAPREPHDDGAPGRSRLGRRAEPAPDAARQRVRWNWDTPIVVSQLRSEDRLHGRERAVPVAPTAASSWKAISPDLTRTSTATR